MVSLMMVIMIGHVISRSGDVNSGDDGVQEGDSGGDNRRD